MKYISVLFGALFVAIASVSPWASLQAQGVPVVVDVQVSSSSDDAYHVPNGWPHYSDTDSTVYAGKVSDRVVWGGWRWTNLNIPAGSTITAAYVDFMQQGWGYVIPTNLAFEDTANPSPFSPSSSPFHRWTAKTTFQVTWTWPKRVPGAWIRTPSLVDGIQELVNTYGAISSIVLLEEGTLAQNGYYHSWESYDSAPLKAAKLHIEYISGVDTTPPVRSNGQPAGLLPAGTTQTTLSLTTDENATCKYGTVPSTPYDLLPNAFGVTGGTSHGTIITGLKDGGAYSFYIRCQDDHGNANTDDFVISFGVDVPDLTPPVRSNGQPTGNLPSGTRQTTISLNTNENATCKYDTAAGIAYSAMTNTFAVTGGMAHSSPVAGLQDGGAYSYFVKCQDASGNANSDDFQIAFEVLPDTVPPVRSNGQPTGDLPSGTTQVTLSLATDENATCKYGTASGTEYASLPNTFSTTGRISHSTLVFGLVDNTVYSYYVRCQDALGNTNSDDYTISFRILPPGPVIVDKQVASSSDDAYHAPNGWPHYSDTNSTVYAGKLSDRVVWGGWRWTNVGIPAGANITEAYVEFMQQGWGYVMPTILTFQDSPNPLTFSSKNSPYHRWATHTIYEQQWTWVKGNPGTWVRTPSLVQGIQELVNRYGAIDTIVLLENGAPAPNGQYHTWESYDSNPAKAAKLHIEYTLAPPSDFIPPARANGQPTGVLPSSITQTALSLSTDENATCKYSLAPGTPFASMTDMFTTTGTTNHETLVTGLSEGNTYHYYVRCQDAAGNANTDDYEISFSIRNQGIGVPWKLVFSSQPTNGLVNGVLPPVQVSVQDKVGTVITSEIIPVTLRLANNEEGAVLTGTSTVNTVNGVATFSDLQIDRAGSYTFVASAPITLRGRWDGGGKYLTVRSEGNYAYLGAVWESGGVNIIDISDPAHPTLAGTWGKGSEDPHEALDVKNGILFSGSEVGTGAAIVDVSNPAFPRELSRITAADGGSDWVHNGMFDGQYAYLVPNRGPHIYIFDVSNPANPVKVRTVTSPSGGQVHDVTAVNGRLYLHDITSGYTHIFDISNVQVSAPLLGSFYSGNATHSSWWTPDYNYLVVAQEPQMPGGTAGIFDVRDPANVQRVATLDPVALGFGDIWPHDPRIVGNILYFAWNTAGLQIFEISDPSDPILVGSYRTSAVTGPAIDGNLEVDPFLGPDRVLASDLQEGLFVLDTTPTSSRSQSFSITP